MCGRAAELVAGVGEPRFEVLEYRDLRRKVADYLRSARTVVHAWTPRERVRQATADAAARLGAPYIDTWRTTRSTCWR